MSASNNVEKKGILEISQKRMKKQASQDFLIDCLNFLHIELFLSL